MASNTNFYRHLVSKVGLFCGPHSRIALNNVRAGTACVPFRQVVHPPLLASPINHAWQPSIANFSHGVVRHDLRTGEDFNKRTGGGGDGGSEKRKEKRRKVLIGGLGGGLLVGVLLGYNATRKKSPNQICNDGQSKDYLLDAEPPYFRPAREIRTANDRSGLKITLFQYQTCPFCCKARAFLDYYGFNYDVVEVNSVLRSQMKWSKYKKVPVVVVQCNDKVVQINDSSVIVSALFSNLVNEASNIEQIMDCYPMLRYYDEAGKERTEIENKYYLMYNELEIKRSKEDVKEERKWRRWTDEVLVHTLSPNVYRTPSESLAAFRWFDEVGDWPNLFQTWERWLVVYVGALAMYFIGKRLKKRHNLKDDVRQSLYDECNRWMKELSKKGTPFMGGSAPNLADLAVFGVLSAIEGCQAFQDARDATKIGSWFDLMKEAVAKRNGQLALV